MVKKNSVQGNENKQQVIAGYIDLSSYFFVLGVAFLLAYSVLGGLKSFIKMNAGVDLTFSIVSIVVYFAGSIVCIHGFGVLSKACKLSEENNCYYIGSHLKAMGIICFVLTVISELVSTFLYIVLDSYDLSSATPKQLNSISNIWIFIGISLLIIQIFSISTVFIVLFVRGRAFLNKYSDTLLKNFALLSMLILLVQLIIGVLASCYIVGGMNASFLSKFSTVLNIVKYAVLLAFFVLFKKRFVPIIHENETSSMFVDEIDKL